jgi:PD-(D/E)XK nuclease superfamily
VEGACRVNACDSGYRREGVVGARDSIDENGLNRLAKAILDAAFAVHTELGPGLLESTYKACLAYELTKRGIRALLEVPVPLVYDGQKLSDVGYRIDILAEESW